MLKNLISLIENEGNKNNYRILWCCKNKLWNDRFITYINKNNDLKNDSFFIKLTSKLKSLKFESKKRYLNSLIHKLMSIII